MNSRAILTGAALALSVSLGGAVAANATVVSFDDLTGSGTVADGYGGIIWGGAWTYYDSTDSVYTPSSPFERVYANYTDSSPTSTETVGFSFAAPVTFTGAYFAGASGFSGVTLSMYLGGVLVGTSATLAQTGTPVFLASGYGGNVDEVRVTGYSGFYVMDDVTYGDAVAPPTEGGGVPEPATWAMMIAGFGLAGAGLRRQRRRAVAV